MLRFALLLAVGGLAACQRTPPPLAGDAVVQVGDQVLTEAEVRQALDVRPMGFDSVMAREQVIEQWIMTEVLAQEARRRGLRDAPEIQRLLTESERAILASAYVDAFYAEGVGEVAQADLAAYFDANRERLRLREPYLQVRYLRLEDRTRADEARALLATVPQAVNRDSAWAALARRYMPDREAAQALATSFLPESRLRDADPALWQAVQALPAGQTTPVIASNNRFHVLQVVQRIPEGAMPQLAWIADELRQSVEIEKRRIALTQHVQDLKNQLQARGQFARADTTSAAD